MKIFCTKIVSQLQRHVSKFKYGQLNYKPLEQIDEKTNILWKLEQVQNNIYDKQSLVDLNNNIINDIEIKNSKELLIEAQNQYLQGFYKYMHQNIFNTNLKKLDEICGYLLSKQGKLIRPLLNLQLAQILFASDGKQLFGMQKDWACVVETLHLASLVHDDIIDNSPERRGKASAHILFGKQSAAYAANFLIGRAGRKISSFNNIHLFDAYSSIMDNLTSGEYIQAVKNKNFDNIDKLIQDYMVKTYYKTASLMAHSCRGVALLQNCDLEVQEICFRVGQHFGIAFQLIDDILDYTASSEQLGKESLHDLKEGYVTGPVLFVLKDLIVQKNQQKIKKYTDFINKQQMNQIQLEQFSIELQELGGVEKTKYLALLHIQKSFQYLDMLKNDKNNTDNLKALGSLIIKRSN